MRIVETRGDSGVNCYAPSKNKGTQITFKMDITSDKAVFFSGDISSLKGFIPNVKRLISSVLNFFYPSSASNENEAGRIDIKSQFEKTA